MKKKEAEDSEEKVWINGKENQAKGKVERIFFKSRKN